MKRTPQLVASSRQRNKERRVLKDLPLPYYDPFLERWLATSGLEGRLDVLEVLLFGFAGG